MKVTSSMITFSMARYLKLRKTITLRLCKGVFIVLAVCCLDIRRVQTLIHSLFNSANRPSKMQKPTPAPIFNHRKRPRQAVFADPQNDPMPGPSGAAPAPVQARANYPELMPPQGFRQGRNPTAQQRAQVRTTGGSNMNTGAAPMNYRNTQASPASSRGRGRFNGQQSYGQQSGSTPNPGNRGRGNTISFNPMPQPTADFQPNKQQPYPTSFGRGQSMGGARNSTPGPYGDMGQQQRGPTATYGGQMPHTMRGGFARNYSTPELGFRNDSQPQFAANTTFGSRDELGLMNDNFNDPSQIKQQPTSTGATTKKPPKDFEKSLHTITCTVAGMRRWNKFRDNIQLLFEIYGYIDSAITKQGHDCKEFLLRDDRKDAIKCHFYEVDRHMPKLTRGQRIRCVGNLDTKTEMFKVMSIRPSQELEREVYKTLVSRSDQLMHRMTKNLREI